MQTGRAVLVAAGLVGAVGLALAAQGVRSAKAQTSTITVHKAPT
jgi:hypothetical protein